MPDVLLTKDERGQLAGYGDKGARAYRKFRDAIHDLEIGAFIKFSYRVPRSPKFHRLHFAMLKTFFDNQEQFSDDYQFRKWTEVGAGHCDFVPGPTGRMVAMPRSIAYEALDDEEFHDVHMGVRNFLRSEHARRFLWPMASNSETWNTVDLLLMEFER